MWMTELEILGNIRRNGGSFNQIKTLAELNACSIFDIEKILRRHDFVKGANDTWVTTEEYKNRADVTATKINKPSLLTPTQKEKICRDYFANSLSYELLANQYGCSTFCIGEIIRKYKIEHPEVLIKPQPVIEVVPVVETGLDIPTATIAYKKK